MRISFESNIREVERGLSDFARTQVPFAVSLAINAAAEDVRRNAAKGLERRLDKPVTFTKRGLTVFRASKRKPEATVFFKDRQAAYLRFQETGGARTPKGRAIVTPAAIRVNAAGNMARGAVRKAAAGANVFSGSPSGRGLPPGLYRRVGAAAGRKAGARLVRLVTFVRSASYRPRLRFQEGAAKTAAARFPGHFAEALARAIASARR